MKAISKKGVFFAVLAACLYALNSPLSKLLLGKISPTLLAGLLYLGAGVGAGIILGVKKFAKIQDEESNLDRSDLFYVILMIALDVIAPISLMFGLSLTTAENTALLNNFEIVATAVIALILFKEKISSRLWFGIAFVTLSCTLLSFENLKSFEFSSGSLLVLLACVCWGVENNCTRKLSSKNPLQIVTVKGLCSGLVSLIIGLCIGERTGDVILIVLALLVGFVAYGLSIFFYVSAQRVLGATRTSAFYAVAPFVGVVLSLLIFQQIPRYMFFIALFVMVIGAWLCAEDKPIYKRKKKDNI